MSRILCIASVSSWFLTSFVTLSLGAMSPTIAAAQGTVRQCQLACVQRAALMALEPTFSNVMYNRQFDAPATMLHGFEAS